MKKLIFIALAVLALSGCQNRESKTDAALDSKLAVAKAPADAPKIKFEELIYDFGVIKAGQKVQYVFKFKNEGETPLIITNATATCGCTQPEYPTEPIKPGAEGTVKVIFDSTGKEGMQDKQITLTTNASPEAEKLHLVGEVKAGK